MAATSMTRESILTQSPVFFCGAGISVDPPAGLPDWHHLRDYTIEAIGSRWPFLKDYVTDLTSVEMIAIPGKRGMTPEVVASIIAKDCRGYFESFSSLNQGQPNSNHLLLARAANTSLIQYILTTNFDLFIEEALRAEGVAFRIYRTDEEFAIFQVGPGVHVLKLHGCISLPATITVTVEDEGKGLSEYKLRALELLLERFPFAFWGYSGADLKIDVDYLRMMTVRDRARGFVWNLYENAEYREAPNRYLLELTATYGQRGLIVHNLFPRAIRVALGDESRDADLGSAVADREAWLAAKDAVLRASLFRWAEENVAPFLACSIFAKLLQHNGQHGEALACFREMASLAENCADGVPFANALVGAWVGMARQHRRLGNNAEAILRFRRALDLARAMEHKQQQAVTLSGLGEAYASRGDLGAALDAYREGETLLEGSDPEGAVNFLVRRGLIYQQQGDFERALAAFQEAENAIRNNGWKRKLANILHHIGCVYSSWGQFADARRHFEGSLEVAQALGEREQLGYCYREIAVVFIAENDDDRARQYLEDALAVARTRGDRQLEAIVISDQALLLARMGRTDESREASVSALDLYELLGDKRNIGRMHLALANYWSRLGKHDEAEKSYRQAIENTTAAGDRWSAGIACQLYANHLHAADRIEEALSWYRTSLSHFRAGGLHQYVPELLPKIAACRRAISGQPEPQLPKWFEAALIRSRVDMRLAQKIAARCGWDKQPFDLAEFCNHLEKEFGRELALLKLGIQAKHQGIEYRESENFVGTLICAALGLDIFGTLNDAHGMSICANDMGFSYMKLGNYPEALKWLENAVAIERSVTDYRELSITLRNLADVYEQLGRPDDADNACLEAEKAIRNVDDSEHLVQVLLAVADILKARKKPEAFAKYDEAGAQAERLADFKALIRVYAGKGKAKWDAGEFVEANTWRARALDLSMQERDFTNAAIMANLIANTYHEKLKISSEAERSYRRAVQIATDAGMPSLAQQFREHAGQRGYDLSRP